jgi:hypothetical protein
MADEISDGPGIATLVVPMPGSVRPPSDTVAAMLIWLSAHGAPMPSPRLARGLASVLHVGRFGLQTQWSTPCSA